MVAISIFPRFCNSNRRVQFYVEMYNLRDRMPFVIYVETLDLRRQNSGIDRARRAARRILRSRLLG